jgi:nitrate/nitrite transport system permease protein
VLSLKSSAPVEVRQIIPRHEAKSLAKRAKCRSTELAQPLHQIVAVAVRAQTQQAHRGAIMGRFLALVSVVLLAASLFAWHLETSGTTRVSTMSPDYARLIGATASLPGPLDVGRNIVQQLKEHFYDRGPNDKGLEIQLAYSLTRVMAGYLTAVAVPIGFLIGMSPIMNRALDPFIQILKPISPLTRIPLALYTIRDSGLSSIFEIFICSLRPMLINTAFAVGTVRKEWLNFARMLQAGVFRRAMTIILPAATPTMLTGVRTSIGTAWLVIVAAEILGAGTGIGYFVRN